MRRGIVGDIMGLIVGLLVSILPVDGGGDGRNFVWFGGWKQKTENRETHTTSTFMVKVSKY